MPGIAKQYRSLIKALKGGGLPGMPWTWASTEDAQQDAGPVAVLTMPLTDVVSAGELHVALVAGAQGEDTFFAPLREGAEGDSAGAQQFFAPLTDDPGGPATDDPFFEALTNGPGELAGSSSFLVPLTDGTDGSGPGESFFMPLTDTAGQGDQGESFFAPLTDDPEQADEGESFFSPLAETSTPVAAGSAEQAADAADDAS